MVVREHPVLFGANRRANDFRLSLTINLPLKAKRCTFNASDHVCRGYLVELSNTEKYVK